jgi:adenylosuccinate synthase
LKSREYRVKSKKKEGKMSVRIVLGTQWGDEGKGKIVDLLSKEADVVVRYQGGANAGHTVKIDDQEFILHLIPTGILHPDKICVIGDGVVVDLEQLFKEKDELKEKGISVENRFLVSDRAHLVMPYHKAVEKLNERKKGDQKIGTTLKGIGPANVDKVGRMGIRIADLLNEEIFLKRLNLNFKMKEDYLKELGEEQVNSLKEESKKILDYKEKIKSFVINSSAFLNQKIKEKKNVLFESAQGTLLDVDFGTYPYVTPSHPTAGGACIGSGVGPTLIDEVIGVVKAYTTRVGEGPFPTELNDKTGEILRVSGNEFGATTGRPRRCGWLDLVTLRHSIRVNGISKLAITKLDVLDNLDPIMVCMSYRYQGQEIEEFPGDLDTLSNCQPVYQELPGWKETTNGLTDYKELPDNARRYLDFIEENLLVPIYLISTGSKRDQTIFV